uniref:Protein DGCR14 n=1 Tax=Rhabditophanes sp. KR3021 TaxID=114890 RepID=A0AC35TI70_9BILA
MTDSCAVFKVPDAKVGINPNIETVKKRKIVKHVLDEKTFLSGLEKIIERDYFPQLKKLKVQTQYADALFNGDLEVMGELKDIYSTRRLVISTPNLLETPSVHEDKPGTSKQGNPPKEKTLLDDLNIDSYLERFTSEDNADYEDIVEAANQELRKKFAWCWEAVENHNKNYDSKMKALMGNQAADEQAISIANNERCDSNSVIGWKAEAINKLFWNPKEVALTIAENIRRNEMDNKVINRKATRLSKDVYDKKGANEGNTQNSKTQEEQMNERFEADSSDLDKSPKMTWGVIDGTPFRLDGKDGDLGSIGDRTPSFSMTQMSVRDQLAHNLVNDIITKNVAKNKKTSTLGNKQGLSTLSRRLGSITPAARSILKASFIKKAPPTPAHSSASFNIPWKTPELNHKSKQ